jgi:hypothetical protein
MARRGPTVGAMPREQQLAAQVQRLSGPEAKTWPKRRFLFFISFLIPILKIQTEV